MKFSEEKAAFNRWEAEVWETSVGIEIRARENRCVLPAKKVDKYSAAIADMQKVAAAHPKRLVPREQVEQAMGRAAEYRRSDNAVGWCRDRAQYEYP